MPPKAAKEVTPVITDTSKFAYINCSMFAENMILLVCTNCSISLLIHSTKLQCLKIVTDNINKFKAQGVTSGPEIDSLNHLRELLINHDALDLADNDGNSVSKLQVISSKNTNLS